MTAATTFTVNTGQVTAIVDPAEVSDPTRLTSLTEEELALAIEATERLAGRLEEERDRREASGRRKAAYEAARSTGKPRCSECWAEPGEVPVLQLGKPTGRYMGRKCRERRWRLIEELTRMLPPA